MLYLFTMTPKRGFREGLSSLVQLVEADTRKAALAAGKAAAEERIGATRDYKAPVCAEIRPGMHAWV